MGKTVSKAMKMIQAQTQAPLLTESPDKLSVTRATSSWPRLVPADHQLKTFATSTALLSTQTRLCRIHTRSASASAKRPLMPLITTCLVRTALLEQAMILHQTTAQQSIVSSQLSYAATQTQRSILQLAPASSMLTLSVTWIVLACSPRHPSRTL